MFHVNLYWMCSLSNTILYYLSDNKNNTVQLKFLGLDSLHVCNGLVGCSCQFFLVFPIFNLHLDDNGFSPPNLALQIQFHIWLIYSDITALHQMFLDSFMFPTTIMIVITVIIIIILIIAIIIMTTTTRWRGYSWPASPSTCSSLWSPQCTG